MLTSLRNPLLQQVRSLHQAKARETSGLMLLEGTHLVEAALETRWPLTQVLAAPSWCQVHPQLWQALQSYVACQLVAEEIFGKLATTTSSPGILALAQRHTPTWQPGADPLILLERIQDPGNLGTILRTAAACGVGGVILSPDSVGADHPKVLRATSGQWFRQPPVVADLEEVLVHCPDHAIIGTSAVAPKNLWEVDLTGPVVLLFGSEGQGLSTALQRRVHQLVHIPQQPGVESLNLAVSVALLLYEVRRQRR